MMFIFSRFNVRLFIFRSSEDTARKILQFLYELFLSLQVDVKILMKKVDAIGIFQMMVLINKVSLSYENIKEVEFYNFSL